MDDYLSYLLKLASSMCHRVICCIEDILFGTNEKASEDGEHLLFDGLRKCSHILHWSTLSNKDSASCEPSSIVTDVSGDNRSPDPDEDIPISSSEIVPVQAPRFPYQGLMFPSYFLKLGCRLLSRFVRCSSNYLKFVRTEVRGFLSRLSTTLQGSSNDIGWLQRCDIFPPVEDRTGRFMELLNDIRNGVHCLPNSLVYLLIPGLFSNLSSLYFVNTKKFFSKMGLACHIAKIHSEASVEKNAWELKLYIEEIYWGSGKKVLLLGHSKGGVDAAAALSIYWPELKGKVAGLALVQCPYGGSPIAADILREGQIADKEARRIMEFIICKIIKGDMKALDDLTYEKRKDFISKHRLPSDEIPLISFHTQASIAPGVLATMSHIAHAELPWLPVPSFFLSAAEIKSLRGGRKVPIVIPLSAAMALSALHLKLRYGEASDGLVTCVDAEVPGSAVVRLSWKLDHAWMVYSSTKRNNFEADASEMCEALLTMLVEMGKRKQVELNSLEHKSSMGGGDELYLY
ncbi:hypothetical protein AXF42_Ash011058 [Apostasia shenzhenica]|uniref:Uncharacterized protein n=1 Tax=Apostasia shenzhenica TaxID=1088818 RepID=A0A2H9ZR07_9ASPA|nr:hypothetical protein AXF42_Ash011058 [Apostasia shenzhenica]